MFQVDRCVPDRPDVLGRRLQQHVGELAERTGHVASMAVQPLTMPSQVRAARPRTGAEVSPSLIPVISRRSVASGVLGRCEGPRPDGRWTPLPRSL